MEFGYISINMSLYALTLKYKKNECEREWTDYSMMYMSINVIIIGLILELCISVWI